MGAETKNAIGWNYEVTEETDPISVATANTNVNLPIGDASGTGYWAYGIHTSDFDLPIEQVQYKPIYYGDPDPAELVEVNSDVTVGHGFIPVNGIEWYKFLGQVANSGTKHTITGMARGLTLPTDTSRVELTGGSGELFISAVGCKTGSLSQTFHMNGAFSTMGKQIDSIRSQQALLNETQVGQPILPSSIANTYRAGSTAFDVFTVNGVDCKSALSSIQFNGVNNLIRTKKSGQAELEYQTETTRAIIISFQYFRGKESTDAIYNAFRNRTQVPLVFGQSQNATNYIKFTFANIAIAEHKGTFLSQQNESADSGRVFDVKAVVSIPNWTGSKIEVVDGVHDNFYPVNT